MAPPYAVVATVAHPGGPDLLRGLTSGQHFTVGRDLGSTIVLPSGCSHQSRHHIEGDLAADGFSALITDRSTHGTFRDGKRLINGQPERFQLPARIELDSTASVVLTIARINP
jgi:pSer/pThr/pTyr-binding forkhead associated (FHA) protein